jgi:four helix bundle protein
MSIETHKDLVVWQRSMQVVVELYKLLPLLPSDERYGLRSQLRRAAVSVPLNIAEGYGRGSRKDWNLILHSTSSSTKLGWQSCNRIWLTYAKC